MNIQYIVKLNTKQAPGQLFTVIAGRDIDDPKYIESFDTMWEATEAYRCNDSWNVCVLEVVMLSCPTADMLNRFSEGSSINDQELLMLLGYYRGIREALTMATSTPIEYHLVWMDALKKYNTLHDFAIARQLVFKFE